MNEWMNNGWDEDASGSRTGDGGRVIKKGVEQSEDGAFMAGGMAWFDEKESGDEQSGACCICRCCR